MEHLLLEASALRELEEAKSYVARRPWLAFLCQSGNKQSRDEHT